jgi:hypothetical protein
MRLRTHKTLDLLRQTGCIQLCAKPNLYKRCLNGMKLHEKLRQQNIDSSSEPWRYSSLAGQQTASLFAEATLDNVLALLIEEKPNGKWSFDIVVDNGLIFGSPEMQPCSSYDEAERRALAALDMIGRSAEPAQGYTPELEPNKKLQIRVNGAIYVVQKIFDDPKFELALTKAMEIEGTTYEGLLARFANLILVDGVENHYVALTMLANCGWMQICQEILDDFCAANGVDDLFGSSDVADDGKRPSVH